LFADKAFRKHATDADVGLLCGFSIAAKGETLFATPLEAWENGGMDTVNAPETLWHYTDTNGLLGILSSKLLMASSATYLNDAAELSYGKYCLADALYPIAERLGWRNHVDEPGYPIRQYAEALSGKSLVGRRLSEIPETFIVSFCEEGDLLSQWRGYSEGSGFALGFNMREIKRHIDESRIPAKLGKVQYGDASSRELFEPVIMDQLFRSSGLTQVDDVVTGDGRWDQFLDTPRFPQINVKELLLEVGWCKHPAFEEEREWRLKANQTASVKVRARRGELLPYMEFPFPPAALSEVRLGPGGNRELRVAAARHALKQHGFTVADSSTAESGGVRISWSSSPYRP